MKRTVPTVTQYEENSYVRHEEDNRSSSLPRLELLPCANILKQLTIFLLLFFGMSLMAWEWDYDEKRDGTVEIVGIDIDEDEETMPSILNIPATLEGMPVTRIGDIAFDSCAELVSVTIPDSVTSIGEGAFSFCSGLTSVKFGNKVTSIGNMAFANCGKLASVELPDSVSSIGDMAFGSCGLESITLGNGVTSIGKMAFAICHGLTEVSIPGNVKHIGDNAFGGCSGLKKVSMGDGVTSIGDEVFLACSELKSVLMPDSITSIGEKAFYGCNKLEKIKLPLLLTEVSDYVFWGCIGLREVIFPENMTKIGEGAFEASGVTNIDLQVTKVAEISKEAFNGCEYLTKITFPTTLKSLGDKAFFNLGVFDPAFIVFRGLPPSCGEKVFEEDYFGRYYKTDKVQRRLEFSFSHTVFGAYMPVDNSSANYDAWRSVIDAWGRWEEVQMVMDVKPIACDYATDNCGELNISWQAFPAYTNDFQKEFWSWNGIEIDPSWFGTGDRHWNNEKQDWIEYGNGVILAHIRDLGVDYNALYSHENWLAFADMKFSIWRSSENPDDAYDDFSCAVNIAQHVGGEFSAEKGFSATNFIDKTFGKFKGTKPVKYWIEIEDPDDPDNLRYLSSGETKPATRIRPIVEPDSCVTRRRVGLAIAVGAFDPNGNTASESPIPEPIVDVALFKQLFNAQYIESNIGYDELINDQATVVQVGDALRKVRYNNEGSPRVQPGDILIMYMAMHGEEGRLVLHDDYYTIEQLYKDMKFLDESSGVKVIAILMACHSQSISDVTVSRDDKLDVSHKFSNVAWITSCRTNQKSTSIGDGLSLFGRCFLDFGWRQGYADIDRLTNLSNMGTPWGVITNSREDGILTFGELADYTFCLAVGTSSMLRSQVYYTNIPLLMNTVVRDDCTRQDVKKPNEPAEFESISANGSVILRWKQCSDIKFYCVYYRTGSDDWEYRLVDSDFSRDEGYISVQFDNESNYKSRNDDWKEKINRFFIWTDRKWFDSVSDELFLVSGIHYRPLRYGKIYEFKVVGVNQAGVGKCSNIRKENVIDLADLSRTGLLQYKGPVFLNTGECAGSLSASVKPVHNIAASAKITNAKANVNDNDGSEVAIEILYANGDDTSLFTGVGFISNGVCNVVLAGGEGNMNVEITSYGIIAEFQGMTAYCLRDTNNYIDEVEEYTATFNANGGSVSPTTRIVANGAVVGTLPIATRDGYTFVGWFTSASGGTQVSTSTKVTANVTYYAHWVQNGGGDEPTDDDPSGGGSGGSGTVEPDADALTLFAAGKAETPFEGNATYNGWVRNADGSIAGLLTVKAAKAAKPEKGGQSKLTITYTPFGGKKQTIKLANDAMPVAGGVATVAIPGVGTVKFTGDALVGVGVDVQAGKDRIKSKDKGEKAAATAAAASKAGVWTFALGTDAGYAAFSVTVDKKGKGKLTGTFPDGTKVSVSAQGVLGDGVLAIPFAYAKKGTLGFVFWVKDDGTAALSDLTGGALGTARPTVVAPSASHRLADGEHVFTAGDVSQAFTVAGKKWNVPKQNKRAEVDPNPTGLKLSFTEKTGAVKGTFTVVDGKAKTKYTVVGAVVGGRFYGSAYVRKAPPFPATAE